MMCRYFSIPATRSGKVSLRTTCPKNVSMKQEFIDMTLAVPTVRLDELAA
jgi:hypothetical protein